MSLRINNNAAAVNSHRNLQINDSAMSKTLEKLSSGMKINRAADSPAALVISENMRGQIAGTNQAIDNSETAISMVQTTEANLNEVSNLLTGIRQLAIHAANEGVNDEVMLEADQKEIENALATIARISEQAQFGTKKLLDGSQGATGSTTGANLEFISATKDTGDSHKSGYEIRISQSATKANVEGTIALNQQIIDEGETFTIIEDGKMASYTTTADDTVDTALKNLRAEINRNGLEIDVNLDEDNKLVAEHKEYGSDHGFQVSSTTAGVLSHEAGEIEVADAGLDIFGTINGESAEGRGQILTGREGSRGVSGLSIKYTGEISDDVAPAPAAGAPGAAGAEGAPADGAAAAGAEGAPAEGAAPAGEAGAAPAGPGAEGAPAGEAGAAGPGAAPVEDRPRGEVVGRVFVNQHSLRFQVGANAEQTVGISVESTNPETLSRGVDNDSGFKNLAEVDVRSFQGAQDAIRMVDQAIQEVSSQRGDLGAFQKNTLESNLNNLRTANENLISSESVIRDTDMAAEMATFTKNQIKSQSATAMLAQANQLPRNVLQLLS